MMEIHSEEPRKWQKPAKVIMPKEEEVKITLSAYSINKSIHELDRRMKRVLDFICGKSVNKNIYDDE